jgi:transposase
MNQMNKGLETIRREDQRENQDLNKCRLLWLKMLMNLADTPVARLATLKKLDLKPARAYQIKMVLACLQEIRDPGKALTYLKSWYIWATQSRLKPIIKAA